jgi:hypothetical protein
MRKAITIFFPLVFFVSCHQNEALKLDQVGWPGLKPTFENTSWNPIVLSIIDSLIVESHCDQCINELYVDKVLPHYILITMKVRTPSIEYMKDKRPLLTANIRGKLFYIYSGLEDVLYSDKKRLELKPDSTINFYMNWTIVLNSDSVEVRKDGGYPFFPSDAVNPYYKDSRKGHVYVK